jgi:hypothetical protein
MQPRVAYNEYKYLVSNGQLGFVRGLLDSLLGGTDPFPEGIVDSVYYDSYDRRSYRQCLDGESRKVKFRIRGYGDGRFVQVHQKEKALFGVAKIKSRIEPVTAHGGALPDWASLVGGDAWHRIKTNALSYGPLIPVVRVRYRRFRYRAFDARVTLDTNVEVSGFGNFVDRRLSHAILPSHVLEVKTMSPRPVLPLLGLMQLPPASFSKFFQGVQLLETGEIA